MDDTNATESVIPSKRADEHLSHSGNIKHQPKKYEFSFRRLLATLLGIPLAILFLFVALLAGGGSTTLILIGIALIIGLGFLVKKRRTKKMAIQTTGHVSLGNLAFNLTFAVFAIIALYFAVNWGAYIGGKGYLYFYITLALLLIIRIALEYLRSQMRATSLAKQQASTNDKSASKKVSAKNIVNLFLVIAAGAALLFIIYIAIIAVAVFTHI